LSKYNLEPISLEKLSTIPIAERGGMVKIEHLGGVHTRGAGFESWLERLPRVLAANQLRELVRVIREARAKGKPVIWGMGGHVVKCGLSPILLDLMRRGYVQGFAMNGSTAIHDFEIAIAGCTSEDVEAVLPDGRFGSAEETGREMNDAIRQGVADGLGWGEALGRHLQTLAAPAFAPQSLLYEAYRAGVPVTVHAAIGTDTPHTHPAVDAAALGTATHYDFRLFARLVSMLDGGGVYINLGSAVVLPEVFLKAISLVRNLGHEVKGFHTANFDFLQHYRPTVNVVKRPHAGAGGRGIALTGHHEIMVPLLAAILVEGDVA
jgi:hypothetical protein